MAMRRITAHFADQATTERATLLVRVEQRTATSLTGDADDDAIELLRDRLGARVRVFDAPAREGRSLLSLDGAQLTLRGAGDYTLETVGPLTEAREAQLDARGARVLEMLAESSALVRFDARGPQAVSSISWVVAVRPAVATRTLAVLGSDLEPAEPLDEAVYDVTLRRDFSAAVVVSAIEELGGRVLGASEYKVRAVLDDPQARRALRVQGVLVIERYVAPVIGNDRARASIDVPKGVRVDKHHTSAALTGAGQTVGVADTGVNVEHEALKPAVAKVIRRAKGEVDPQGDPDGHGTHVSGTIAGSGAGSKNKRLRGVAPDAKLVVQALANERKILEGLPADLCALFTEAYSAEARVHNNSWAANTRGAYTNEAREVDGYVWDNRDMLLVFAAGNMHGETVAPEGERWSHGAPSVGSPASAKNALTVGAHKSDRGAGGDADKTHGKLFAKRFSKRVAQQKLSGDAEELAAFSGRGPAEAHRIKPDLVAPGTTIASTSFVEAWRRQDGYETPGPADARGYGFKSGTSMATPIVAGAAALVRQYYVQRRGHVAPSAALLKATLINGARPLSGVDAKDGRGERRTPNCAQGFGALDLSRSLPSSAERKLAFADAWTDRDAWLSLNESHVWRLLVIRPSELLIALVHTDTPGPAIVHGLTLTVSADATIVQVGNEALDPRSRAPDHRNNAQVVRIKRAQGPYELRVTFEYGPTRGRQDYALVAVGALERDTFERA